MAKAKEEKKKKGKRNATSFTSETAKAANKKSRESARRNRSMREWAKFYGKQQISLKMPDGGEEKATWDGAVIIGLYRKAMTGDAQAAKLIADYTGQTPAMEANVNVKGNLKREPDLTPQEAAEFIAELSKRI